MGIYNLISAAGIIGLLCIAWICSKNRRIISWRVVFWGVGLQLIFGLFVFLIPAGGLFFEWINILAVKIISFANTGTYFVFGPLSVSPGSVGPGGEESLGFILAFQALPAVIFFSGLMALFYHFGLMQKVITLFSRLFTRLMGVSGAESLCASSNIAVGIESAFTIRPYIGEMTKSELCTVLTAGMATIASTVLAVYVSFLQSEFPSIAGHLISASIISAPAAVVMSKIIYPENEKPLTLGRVAKAHYKKSSSWIESIIRGSQDGVRLCVGIVALLIAFLGILKMANWFVGVLGSSMSPAGVSFELSLEKIFSFLYYPFTWMMGIPVEDIPAVAALLGERTIVTELVSYQHLSRYISDGTLTNPRSIIIVSYALCGFSHIASLAIFVGGISALVPERAKDLARLGLRALFAATLACLMTGAVAGVFAGWGNQAILKF